jgi:hypothetical protein
MSVMKERNQSFMDAEMVALFASAILIVSAR